MDNYKIAYISRVIYPSPAAHALQMIQMAAAFARETENTHLFVHALEEPEGQIRGLYNVENTPLGIWSLHANKWPSCLYQNGKTRYLIYNSAVAGILKLHPMWWYVPGKKRVIFTRSRREMLYWGLMRPYMPRFRDWVFIYEAHDMAGLDPNMALNGEPFEARNSRVINHHQRVMQALINFDIILCVTDALARDLVQWSNGMLQPYIVRHASHLPRLSHAPDVMRHFDKVVLGYIGTIDKYRGVDTVVNAMRFLPSNYHLRLVGRVSDNTNGENDKGWLQDFLNDPDISSRVTLAGMVKVNQVTAEIDRCDIVLQPASSHIFTLRYASPLKSFDYMVRGKPIVVADVPCHRELFQDRVNARLYRHDDERHLAACIRSLVEQPRQMETIARAAWEQSVSYDYDVRAQTILNLVDQVAQKRNS